MEFIRTAHFDDVGVCFDFGHANMMSDVPQAFETVKNHIHSTHVHDNAKDQRFASVAGQWNDRLETGHGTAALGAAHSAAAAGN